MTRRSQLGALGALVALVGVVGCGGDSSTDDEDVVEIMGSWRDGEADSFAEVLAPFEAISDIDIRFVGSADFVRDLRQRAGEGADPPDIAAVPQLGLIEELISQGQLIPLHDDVRSTVIGTFGLDEGTANDAGDVYAIPFRLSVKSLVWYRPDVFEEHGWEIPETLDELATLVETVQDDTEFAPWCFSIEAGSATGWAATDWVEDLVLRNAGADVYQEWVEGDVQFADDAIAPSFQEFHDLVLAPGRVAAGLRTVLERPVDEAWGPLLTDPPGCALYKQADFATSWMPDGIEIGPDGDVDFFLLPGVRAGDDALVVGGDYIVQFRSSEDIDEVMAYLAGPRSASIWAEQGGFIAANPDVDEDVYPHRYRASIDNAAEGAEVTMVDASDWMPPDVGSGLLWELISQWIAGTLDYPTFAEQLDEAMAGALDRIAALDDAAEAAEDEADEALDDETEQETDGQGDDG